MSEIPKSILSDSERAERDQLEQIVSAGVMSFIEVGNALLTISDKRLYRETHGSFEPYCREKWGMSARRAYQLCEAAKTVATVKNFSQLTTDSQARELAKVSPAKREAVLEKAKKSGKVTAKAIKEAAQDDPEPTEDGLIPGPPPPVDEKWLAAMGKAEASEFKPSEPMVTEYYNRLEALVNDALENATEKQLNSMAVYAKVIPGLVRDELNQRKVRK